MIWSYTSLPFSPIMAMEEKIQPAYGAQHFREVGGRNRDLTQDPKCEGGRF